MNTGILTKADLQKAYPFGLLKVDKSRLTTYHESSGTEGNPIASYFTENDWNDITSRFLRGASELKKEDTFFIKTPYSMVTTAHQAHKAGERVGCLVIPADNRSTLMPYHRVVQLLKSLNVTVTWSLPSEVMMWALAAREQGLNPVTDFPALRAFWVAGEALSASKKRALSEIWGGKPVIEDYGCTETGSLAGECKAGNLHTWNDRLKFEVYNRQTGEISGQGRGELLITTLFREAMPLHRYLIGDEVILNPSLCPCGSNFQTLHVLGRLSSRVVVQGRVLYPRELEDEIFRVGISFGLTLWRAFYDENSLEIHFANTTNDEVFSTAVQMHLIKTMKIDGKVIPIPRSNFVSDSLFTKTLEFSKPIYLFRRLP